jgi:ATP-dependent RNA helicase HelY
VSDSPADRYAAFRSAQESPALADFRAHYPFPFDPFQMTACRALESGAGVLVAAPTGSGKTIVGEFAVHLALEQGKKCFYTTPIKALSNQKYNDLADRYGEDRVGLLTGDNSINGDAPIVVMTTEVLRNMIYAGSHTLLGLGFVVMDEVHYLADKFRGAVWEEVIINLPESVAVVSLSATVSNAEEFGEWLSEVRGETVTVLEETRPVPLYQHIMVGKRMYDLFDPKAPGTGKVNPELFRAARDDWNRRPSDRRGSQRPRRTYATSRLDVVDRLDREALLPAIYFIFSRVGCDAAVNACLAANVRLTTAEERTEITRLVEDRCASIPESDLHVLGYYEFAEALARGVASHHAGMLPTFKEVVEELFVRGLCKVVFATETLALGINMPARSVVLERLVKFNGETHADITPGEYTQLTGRAGRRGIDVEGHGVVLWAQGMDVRQVAGLASTRTYPLNSSFRPSYNMAVNLVQRVGRDRARGLLESSFAQFQADRATVGLARQVRKAEEGLEGYQEAAQCHLGDFAEYAALRRDLKEAENAQARGRRSDRRAEIVDSLDRLRPGDVIVVPVGKFSGHALVIDPGTRSGDGPRPLVLTLGRHARRLSMVDFNGPVDALTRMRVPPKFNARDAQSRRDLANALAERVKTLPRHHPPRHGKPGIDPDSEQQITSLRNRLRRHPCHNCEEREDHARWAERAFKMEREARTLRRRIDQRTNSIARQFDRICELLTELGYLQDWQVTPEGERLMRIYSELDLVVAEALRRGLWDELTPAELAAVLAILVYEARRADDGAGPKLPEGSARAAIASAVQLWGELSGLERQHGLDSLREPDLGFAWAAYRWAQGSPLDEVLIESDLAAGDFVRWTKQLVDLAAQVADVSGRGALRATARACVDSLRRGVVAYSTLTD